MKKTFYAPVTIAKFALFLGVPRCAARALWWPVLSALYSFALPRAPLAQTAASVSGAAREVPGLLRTEPFGCNVKHALAH